MNALTTQPEVYRPSAAIDPQRLDYLWSLAERMARSTLVPDTLKTTGSKNNKKNLEPDEIVSNVFAVVEQADRWNISPFALLACSAIVHGRLGFEGKVIATVLESLFHVELHHYFTGSPMKDDYHIYLSDTKLPADVIAVLKPGFRHPAFKIMDGSVSEWKTSGEGSPWRPATYGKMLVYRGSREWARIYKPAAILGVLGDDELYAIGLERQAQLARDVTPSLNDRFNGGKAEGFNPDNLKQISSNSQAPLERFDPKTGEIIESGAQREATGRETSPAKATSAKPASTDAGRGGATSEKDSRPHNSSESASGDKSADSGEQRPRLSADAFRKYASSLARVDSQEKVERVDREFWAENGGVPAKGTPDYKLGSAIYRKQLARAKGEVAADGLLDEINADIDQSYDEKGDEL